MFHTAQVFVMFVYTSECTVGPDLIYGWLVIKLSNLMPTNILFYYCIFSFNTLVLNIGTKIIIPQNGFL